MLGTEDEARRRVAHHCPAERSALLWPFLRAATPALARLTFAPESATALIRDYVLRGVACYELGIDD